MQRAVEMPTFSREAQLAVAVAAARVGPEVRAAVAGAAVEASEAREVDVADAAAVVAGRHRQTVADNSVTA